MAGEYPEASALSEASAYSEAGAFSETGALEIGPAPVPAPAADPDGTSRVEPRPEPGPDTGPGVGPQSRLRTLITAPRIILLVITATAATLYAWSLPTDGLETFYAAGVRSMSESWKNFFFDAFDPHGTMTLDKLPGAFWIQALFVRAFGYRVWAMVLPQVIESTLTILVLYRAVRRTAGVKAALAAAAILALSPVTVTTARGNLAEPLFNLLIVLAADAALRAVTTGRRRSWYAAAAWVALAFQAKMTEAWLVLPALALAAFAAAPAGARRKAVLRIGAGTALALAGSLVWMTAFTLTPAAERPYADASTGNSVFQQVFDYNGLLRVDSALKNGYLRGYQPSARAEQARAALENGVLGHFPPGPATRPAWDRLFAGPLAPDAAWLLPAAVLGAGAAFAARRRRGRGDPARAAVLLWSLWLVAFGAVFSVASEIHDYYLATLAPAVAALAGTGLAALWHAARAGSARAAAALAAVLALQLAWVDFLVRGLYHGWWWALAPVDAALVAAVLLGTRPRDAAAAGSLAAAALALAVPLGSADVWTVTASAGPFDTALSDQGTLARPSAPVRAAFVADAAISYGGGFVPAITTRQWSAAQAYGASLEQYVHQRHGSLLVLSSGQAGLYIVDGVTDVVPFGGFSGLISYPSLDGIHRMVDSGEVVLAVLPGPQLDSTDPRALLIERICRQTASSGPSHVVYNCQSPTG